MYRTDIVPTPASLAVAAFLCVTAVPVMAASVTITNSACASFSAVRDQSGNVTVTCDSSNPPPPPPAGAPSCTSLTASPASLSTGGGPVALTAEGCTAGASLNWTATPAVVGLSPTTTANTQSVSVTSTTTFSATPVLNGIPGNPVSRDVSVAVPPVEPPGTVGSCSGFSATRVIQASVPPNGGNNLIINTAKYGGFGANDAVVVAFQAPADDPAFGISAVPPSGAAGSQHNYVVASKPCIFDKADPSAVGGALQTKNSFTVNMQSTVSSVFGRLQLLSGRTYYLNLSHKGLCTATSCDLQLTFTNTN